LSHILDKIEVNVKYINLTNKNLKGILNLNRFKNLKKISCSHNQLTDIDLYDLDWTLKELDCENNLITEFAEIPNTLIKLNIKSNPLKKLIFNPDSNFDSPIETLGLSDCLTHLKFGWKFNHPVDNLPSELIVLNLGDKFNCPIFKLPPKLKYLSIGDEFNKELKNLPDTLIYIDLGLNFNKELTNLPSDLYWLALSEKYTKLAQIKLPPNVAHLYLGTIFNKSHNLIKN